MPGYDDHDLERRLREERPQAREEFVQGLAAEIRRRRAPAARPRLTLALALSLALLVSMVAFGGVGAASSALKSSAAAVRSAVDKAPKARGGHSNNPPAKQQYHEKVAVCYPVVHYVVTYKWVTQYKWVWKSRWHNGHKQRYRVKVPVLVKVRVRVRTVSYSSKTVSSKRVPQIVSNGGVYPVPAGGCSSISNPT